MTSKIGSGKTAVMVTNVPANTIYGAPTAALFDGVRIAGDASPHLVGVVSGATVGRGVPGEPYSWTAWQNLWKTEPWKTDA